MTEFLCLKAIFLACQQLVYHFGHQINMQVFLLRRLNSAVGFLFCCCFFVPSWTVGQNLKRKDVATEKQIEPLPFSKKPTTRSFNWVMRDGPLVEGLYRGLYYPVTKDYNANIRIPSNQPGWLMEMIRLAHLSHCYLEVADLSPKKHVRNLSRQRWYLA